MSKSILTKSRQTFAASLAFMEILGQGPRLWTWWKGLRSTLGFPLKEVSAQITSCWRLDMGWDKGRLWACPACLLMVWTGPRHAGGSCCGLGGRLGSRVEGFPPLALDLGFHQWLRN